MKQQLEQSKLEAGQVVQVNGREQVLKERQDRFGLERWVCESGAFVYASDPD